MKTLGIMGGVGPESTVEYYRTIIRLYQDRAGNGSYPEFLISSIDMRKELELIAAGDLAGLTHYLIEEMRKLAAAGVDFGLIASNTPHLVFDEVAAGSPIPMISIVEAAASAAKAQRWSRPALFGTRFTMQGNFYPKVFSGAGVQLILPDRDAQEFIHDKYMNELVPGIFLPETRAGLLAIVDRMRAEQGIDAVILGGTELPLILRDPEHNGVPFLDTMRVHAEAAVSMMMG